MTTNRPQGLVCRRQGLCRGAESEQCRSVELDSVSVGRNFLVIQVWRMECHYLEMQRTLTVAINNFVFVFQFLALSLQI